MIREQYTNEHDWLEARKRDFGTGGSEAAVILGISPFKTIDELFDEKMGLVEPKDISASPAVQRGKALEPLLRADAQYRLKEFYEIEWHPFDILRDEEYPFVFATLDGDMIRKRDGARGIYEAKTGTYNRKTLDAWEQGIPQHYFAQNCQQLIATGWNYVVDHASVSTAMDSEIYFPVERRFFRYFDLNTPGVRTTMATVKKCLIDFHYCCEHQIRPTSHLTWGGKYRS